MSRTQYFYYIFTINHTWLIIISSKNLWQINCGNDIAENVKKKKICQKNLPKFATFAKFFFFFFFLHYRQWDCHNCQNIYIYIYFFFTFSAMGLPQLPKQFFFFFFTFSAMPLPQLICHKFFELIIINHVWFIVKIL